MLSATLRANAMPTEVQLLTYKADKCHQRVQQCEEGLKTLLRDTEGPLKAAAERAELGLSGAMQQLNESRTTVEGLLSTLGPSTTHSLLSTIESSRALCGAYGEAVGAQITSLKAADSAKRDLIYAQREHIAVLGERCRVTDAELKSYVLATRHLSDVLFAVRRYVLSIMSERAAWQHDAIHVGLNPANLIPEESLSTVAGTDTFLGKCERLLAALEKAEAPKMIGGGAMSRRVASASSYGGGGGAEAPPIPQQKDDTMTIANERSFINASPTLLMSIQRGGGGGDVGGINNPNPSPATSPSRLQHFLPPLNSSIAFPSSPSRHLSLAQQQQQNALPSRAASPQNIARSPTAVSLGSTFATVAPLAGGDGEMMNNTSFAANGPNTSTRTYPNLAASVHNNPQQQKADADFALVTSKLIVQMRDAKRSAAAMSPSATPLVGNGGGAVAAGALSSSPTTFNALSSNNAIVFVPPTIQSSCANPPNYLVDDAATVASGFIKRAEVLRQREIDAEKRVLLGGAGVGGDGTANLLLSSSSQQQQLDTIQCGERAWRIKGGDSSRWVKPREELALLKLMLVAASSAASMLGSGGGGGGGNGADVSSLLDALHSAHERNYRLKASLRETITVKCRIMREGLNVMRRELLDFALNGVPQLTSQLSADVEQWARTKGPALIDSAAKDAMAQATRKALEAQRTELMRKYRLLALSGGGGGSEGTPNKKASPSGRKSVTKTVNSDANADQSGGGDAVRNLSFFDGSTETMPNHTAPTTNTTATDSKATLVSQGFAANEGVVHRSKGDANTPSRAHSPHAAVIGGGAAAISAAREQFLDGQRAKQQQKLHQQERLIRSQHQHIFKLEEQIKHLSQALQQFRAMRAFPPPRKSAAEKSGSVSKEGSGGADANGDESNSHTALLLRIPSFNPATDSSAASPAELMMTRVGVSQSAPTDSAGGVCGEGEEIAVLLPPTDHEKGVFQASHQMDLSDADESYYKALLGAIGDEEGGEDGSEAGSQLLGSSGKDKTRRQKKKAVSIQQGDGGSDAANAGGNDKGTVLPLDVLGEAIALLFEDEEPKGADSDERGGGGGGGGALLIKKDSSSVHQTVVAASEATHAAAATECQRHDASGNTDGCCVQLMIDNVLYTIRREGQAAGGEGGDDDLPSTAATSLAQKVAEGTAISAEEEGAEGGTHRGNSVVRHTIHTQKGSQRQKSANGQGNGLSSSYSSPAASPLRVSRPWGKPFRTVLVPRSNVISIQKEGGPHPNKSEATSNASPKHHTAANKRSLVMGMDSYFNFDRSLVPDFIASESTLSFRQAEIDKKIEAALDITSKLLQSSASRDRTSHRDDVGAASGSSGLSPMTYNPNADASLLHLPPSTLSSSPHSRGVNTSRQGAIPVLPPPPPTIPSPPRHMSANALAMRGLQQGEGYTYSTRMLEVLSTSASASSSAAGLNNGDKRNASAAAPLSYSPSPPRQQKERGGAVRRSEVSLQDFPTLTSPREPVHYREVEEAEALPSSSLPPSSASPPRPISKHPLLLENQQERAQTAESRTSPRHQRRAKY